MMPRVNDEPERRSFLRQSSFIASGIVIPGGFAACISENERQTTSPRQTFVQPPMLEARNGLLDLTLVSSYFNTRWSGEGTDRQYPVSLRAYGYDNHGPGFSGPTLIVKGGDQLRIKLINNLPVNPPLAAFRDPLNYINPNTTNLHTHGLHVSPGINTDRNPLEYGDFVVDPNGRGIQPRGDSRQYVYHIPKGHPEGPYYYHPQYHGSSAIQTASLMSGAIMVRGPVDDLPEMAQATELIFLFQAPYFANASIDNNHGANPGSLEKFGQIAINPTGKGIRRPSSNHLDSQPVLINGVRRPTIVMQSGEVQRWRFINTQVFNYLNLSLDAHTFHEYTTDGWGRTSYREYPGALRDSRGGIALAPGNRSSVLIKAGEPGTYMLRSLPFTLAQGKATAILPGDILAYIVVTNQKKVMDLAPTPLPVSSYLDPITDQEFADAGGRKRSIVFNILGNEIRTPSRAISSSGYQLQPANIIVQNVVLGAIEEWTVFNFNDIAHSFHIHVNPMYITRVNGSAVEPYWCDTVALPAGGTPEMPTSVTFRMRFNDFVGPYILHSQMLPYSDLGMVQRVTVIPA
jgi:FtsP/CotA-like multicopper oxidase with cupredoxin domain